MKVWPIARAVGAAENTVFARPLRRLDAGRQREGTRLDHRVGNRVHVEEPVLIALDRTVGLQRILIVGVVPVADRRSGQRVDETPAIGNGNLVGGKRFRRRRPHRARIVGGWAAAGTSSAGRESAGLPSRPVLGPLSCASAFAPGPDFEVCAFCGGVGSASSARAALRRSARRTARDAAIFIVYLPSQTFCWLEFTKGAAGQLT